MTDIWYQGRPPLCSERLIWLLNQYIEVLQELLATQDKSYIDQLHCLVGDALDHIEPESEDCYHSDKHLNNLGQFFAQSYQAVQLFCQGNAWEELLDLTATIMLVRDQLIAAQEGATDATQTERAGRTGTDRQASLTGQEERPVIQYEAAQESEGTLRRPDKTAP